MTKKGIRVRYADFFILRSIFKGTVDMNLVNIHLKYKCCFCIVKSKSKFTALLSFHVLETFQDKY